MAIQKKTYIDFLGMPEPNCHVTNAVGGTCVAATGDTVLNEWSFSNGAKLVHRQELACADIIPTKAAGVGLLLPNDQIDDEGGEIIVSDSVNATGPCFTVGTDAAFRFDLKLKIPDVSDYDVLGMGFRKQSAIADAFNAAAKCITLYDDIAMLNVDNGDIETNTRLGGATGTITDTTDNWADAATKTLSVLVSAAGVVTFQIDGAAPTAGTHALTFDDGEVVIPFFAYAKDANGADTPPILVSWFSGHQ